MMKFYEKNHHFLLLVFIVFSCLLFFTGCKKQSANTNTKTLINGYYIAEMNDFDFYGWKDFVSIYVNNGHITTVEYNAKNASGFIRSWDQDFMRAMNAVDFTYPNRYTREYVFALLNFQDLERIDVVSGATHSYHSFILLSQAVIEQARKGDNQIALVKMPLQRHQYENENN